MHHHNSYPPPQNGPAYPGQHPPPYSQTQQPLSHQQHQQHQYWPGTGSGYPPPQQQQLPYGYSYGGPPQPQPQPIAQQASYYAVNQHTHTTHAATHLQSPPGSGGAPGVGPGHGSGPRPAGVTPEPTRPLSGVYAGYPSAYTAQNPSPTSAAFGQHHAPHHYAVSSHPPSPIVSHTPAAPSTYTAQGATFPLHQPPLPSSSSLATSHASSSLGDTSSIKPVSTSTSSASTTSTFSSGAIPYYSAANASTPSTSSAAAITSSASQTLYKAEMTESQVNAWQLNQRQTAAASTIKVEVPISPTRPNQSPVISSAHPSRPSSHASPSISVSSITATGTASLGTQSSYYQQQQQPQQPQTDIQAQIQIELKRQSQLQALRQHNRKNSDIGGGPASPLPSWTQSPLAGTVNPTPVEYQSSLTDNSPIVASYQESSLTTMDVPVSSANGAESLSRPDRPYSLGGASNPGRPSSTHYPSAIEDQSSLTEVGAPPSAIEHQSSLTEIDASTSGVQVGSFAQSSHPNHPNRYQTHQPQQDHHQGPRSPSAIESQSSLTVIDNLPHGIHEQSSLTEIDNLPTLIEQQSSLTVVDDLPHALHEQSPLTVVDDLPHGLHEQSSLTVVDDLPHALHEQSPLTTVDDHSSPQSNSHITSTSKKESTTNESAETPAPEPAPESAPASVFSMSNWTLPSDFSLSNAESAYDTTNPSDNNGLKSPTGSLHRRSPATMHLNTTVTDNDTVLIPVVPGHGAEEDAATFSTQRLHSPLLARNPSATTAGSLPHPPVPAPKPASLTAAKLNPQAGSTGASLTISEEIHLAMLPSTDLPTDTAGSTGAELRAERDEEEGEEEEEEEEYSFGVNPAKVDDGVSAFIRELQSSISLTRSDSGASNPNASTTTTTAATTGHTQEKATAGHVSRTDSNSSRTSQRAHKPSVDAPKNTGGNESSSISQDHFETSQETSAQELSRQNSMLSRAQSYELPHLESPHVGWTFTESEKATYERIFSLWERPAEECVSTEIAGKVFMTLGLMNSDLIKVWELLNAGDNPVLSRTLFIAGLHLVNYRMVMNELPDQLPDELMMSAAAVGRVKPPPRPLQGPNAIVESHPVSNIPPMVPSMARLPAHTGVTTDKVGQSMTSQGISTFMPNYSLSFSPPPPAAEAPSDIYMAYPYQPGMAQPGMTHPPGFAQQPPGMEQQPGFPQPKHLQYQQQHQPMYPPYPPMSPPTPAFATPLTQAKQTTMHATAANNNNSNSNSSTNNNNDNNNLGHNAYSSSSTNSSPANSNTLVQVQRPGPHAVHNLPKDALVFFDGEDLSNKRSTSSRQTVEPTNTGSATNGTTAAPPRAGSSTSTGTMSSTATPAVVKAQNTHSIHNASLYASPPTAWDHDAAAVELDVEGNYIKYRSDFKNDMTVSASVTANHPINPKSGVFYFEIMIDRFKGNSAMSIGISSKQLRKNCQVGWDLNSWGYHSDDGFLYFGNGKQNIAYEYGYAEGDTVGCGVNFLEKTVFFTLNGDMLGVAFKFLKDSIPLYPAIGLSQAGTEINANFGDQTFLFNIAEYKKRVSGKPLISQPKITWNSGIRNDKVFKVLPDGLSVIASGNDAGCIRGPKLSPRDKDVFYFEVTILYMPPTELGSIVVGICGKNQNMNETLGWNDSSYGYSGECGDFLSLSSNRSSLNARSQSGKMKARARGPPFRSGSVVGCGVDFASRELFFTLNGECLGQAFYDVDVLDCYPSVSVVDGGGGVGGPLSLLQEQPSMTMSSSSSSSSRNNNGQTAGFEFKANFGQSPFLFDLIAFEASEGLP
ncbi:hypothetical protein BGZ94_001713 [Podila epigama]|nr:hypothetical protein BGZ94_001713 [Podila epigama]